MSISSKYGLHGEGTLTFFPSKFVEFVANHAYKLKISCRQNTESIRHNAFLKLWVSDNEEVGRKLKSKKNCD